MGWWNERWDTSKAEKYIKTIILHIRCISHFARVRGGLVVEVLSIINLFFLTTAFFTGRLNDAPWSYPGRLTT